LRVAFLTNFIPPYRVPLYEAIMRQAGDLRIFISTHMEANRDWQAEWGALDVAVQRTLTMNRTWRGEGFKERFEVHVPYDTIAQLRRWRPDVILTGQMGARSLQAVWYAQFARKPVVLWAMLSDHLEKNWGTLRSVTRRWLVKQVDSIIVNGESGARYFHRLGVPDERLLRVHQSVDMQALLALPIERDHRSRVELLHVGSVSERKGVHLLLDAVELWADRNPDRHLNLTLVGDGPLRPKLQERTERPNVSLRWVGSVPYEQLPQWYSRGDVLVFPSLGDEWGLVVNEALAAGVPVLGSSYSQAVDELIRDGVNGWKFRPDHAASIAEMFDRALTLQPTELARMRAAARASIRDWTPEAAAARIVQRLREVAA
jgi:glycosyltransferase involved in cell wall biosynthesis